MAVRPGSTGWSGPPFNSARARVSLPRASSIWITAWLSPPRAMSDMITTRARVSGGSAAWAVWTSMNAWRASGVTTPLVEAITM